MLLNINLYEIMFLINFISLNPQWTQKQKLGTHYQRLRVCDIWSVKSGNSSWNQKRKLHFCDFLSCIKFESCTIMYMYMYV